MIKLGGGWDEKLADIFNDEHYLQIREFLKDEYSHHVIYPSMYDIFNAFKFTPYDKLKAVILGQDPYHEEGQAHGLSFSVNKGIKIPPSLVNIYKELYNDLGIPPHEDGYLKKWAEQGVLLLNTVLTVRQGLANSHKGKGWEWFTDSVIKVVNEKETPVVFILWGANARSKKSLIDTSKHYVIESAHPSPLSCYNGFFGSKPFSKTNDFLISRGMQPIDWDLSKN